VRHFLIYSHASIHVLYSNYHKVLQKVLQIRLSILYLGNFVLEISRDFIVLHTSNLIVTDMLLNVNQTDSNMFAESLKSMHFFLPNQILFILFCAINIFMNSLSIMVFFVSPLFNHRSMFLIKALMINDFCMSLFMIILNSWHLMNNIIQMPELMGRKKCSYITSPVGFFIGNNTNLSLLISVDRFLLIARPQFHKNRVARVMPHIFYVSLVLNSALMVASSFDTFPKDPLKYCTSRSNGEYAFAYKNISYVVFTVTTLLVYILTLLVLKCKQAAVEDQAQQENNLAQIRLKVNRKVSKIIIWTMLCYSVMAPMHSTFSAIFKFRDEDLDLSFNLYYSLLVYVEGTMYTLGFIFFLDDFRRALRIAYENVFLQVPEPPVPVQNIPMVPVINPL